MVTTLLLSAVPALAAAGTWEKSLKISLGVTSALTRIYVDHQLLKLRTSELDFHLEGSLNRESDHGSWKNSLKVDYAGAETTDPMDPDKDSAWTESSDQLIADSVYRRKIGSSFEPYAGLNVQTVVYDGGYSGEWRAFKPLQTRESLGLSAPVLSTYAESLDLRAGYFYQHYVNQDRDHRYAVHGVETVVEFNGKLAKNITLESKAGMYSALVKTPDYEDPETKSRKMVLEWDNRLEIALTKFISIDIILNLDNKDVSSKRISYEIDHRTILSVDWKLPQTKEKAGKR